MTPLRIIFFGTAELSCASLEKLARDGRFAVVAVVVVTLAAVVAAAAEVPAFVAAAVVAAAVVPAWAPEVSLMPMELPADKRYPSCA